MDDPVAIAGNRSVAVGGERCDRCRHVFCRRASAHFAKLAPGKCVPQSNRFVPGSQQIRAIGRKGNGVDFGLMACKTAYFPAACDFPKPRRLISATGRHVKTILRNGHGGNTQRVPRMYSQFDMGCCPGPAESKQGDNNDPMLKPHIRRSVTTSSTPADGRESAA